MCFLTNAGTPFMLVVVDGCLCGSVIAQDIIYEREDALYEPGEEARIGWWPALHYTHSATTQYKDTAIASLLVLSISDCVPGCSV